MRLNFEYPSVLFFVFLCIPAFILFKIQVAKYFSTSVVHFCRNETERKAFLVKKNLQGVFFAFAWVCAVVGAAGPFYGNKTELIRKSGSEIIFVFDVSRSMIVSDVPPSRLSVAALRAKSIVDGLGKSPCGIVLVKGSGVLAVPVTADHSALYALIDSLSPALVTSPGTGLSDGVLVAASSFSTDRDTASFIILFSDGDETSGDLINAAFTLREKNIALISVGVGTFEGSDIDVYADPSRTEIKRTMLNEAVLKSAAEAAGGRSFYVRATDTGTVERIRSAVSVNDSGFVMVVASHPVNCRPRLFTCALCCFIAGIAFGIYWRKQ